MKAPGIAGTLLFFASIKTGEEEKDFGKGELFAGYK